MAATQLSPQLSPTHLSITGRQPRLLPSHDHQFRSCDLPISASSHSTCDHSHSGFQNGDLDKEEMYNCNFEKVSKNYKRQSVPTLLEYKATYSHNQTYHRHENKASIASNHKNLTTEDHNHYLITQPSNESPNSDLAFNNLPPQCDSGSNSTESSPDGGHIVPVPSPPDNGCHGSQTNRQNAANREARCEALEKKHVHDVYEKTAHHFEGIRFKAWPKVRQFLQDLDEGSLVADVGCGQGKYLHINKSLYKVGSDMCGKLVEIAHSNHHEAMMCDNLALPYRDNCFDAVISIGVIHHLTTRERRAAAVAELARVLRPGGRVMIYVWAMEQKQRKFKSQDVLVPLHLKTKHHKKDITVNDEGSDTEHDQPIKGHKSRSHHRKSQELILDSKSRKETLKNAAKMRSKSASSPLKSHKLLVSPSHSLVEADLETFNADDKEVKVTRPVKSPSIPSLIKLHILSLFGSPVKERKKQKEMDRKAREERIKAEYREMFEQILKEDFENFRRHKPMLEHSMSAPESEVFAVREFPQSSRPKIEKHSSLDSSNPSNHNAHISTDAKSYRPLHMLSSGIGHNAPHSALDTGISTMEQESEGDLNSVNASPESEYVFSESPDNSISMPCHSSHNGATSKPNAPSLDDKANGCISRAKFTIGDGSDSEAETWVQATTKAIRTVESQVERMNFHRYYVHNNMAANSDGSCFVNSRNLHAGMKAVNGRNGVGICLDNPRVKTLSQGHMSTSSMSSFSSDTGTFSDSDSDELGSLFDTDNESNWKNDKQEQVEEDDVFESSPKNENSPKAADNSVEDKKADAHENARNLESDRKKEGECSDDTNESFKRFYHVFREGELDDLIGKYVENLHVIDSYYDHANWCVVAEKVNVWTI